MPQQDSLPQDESSSGRNPSVMPRGLAIIVGIAAVLVAAQAVQEFQGTIASAFMALNLVIVVWPVQRFLARFVPKALATLVSGALSVGILVALIWALGWAIARLIVELPKYSHQFNTMIDSVVGFASRIGIDTNRIADMALDQLQSINVSSIVSTLGGIAGSLSSGVGLLMLVVMILIFMIMDSTDFSERMQRLGERHNPTLAWALGSFAKGTRKYWVVATIFGLIVAFFDWILLAALGVPLAIVWAVLSFVTNYIPNIGFLLGLVPPVLMALLAVDPLTALWVALGYSVLNVLIQTVIQPRFTGDAVGITSTIAVLSLLVWAIILGPLGALLAIPATLLMKTLLIDIDPQARWLNAFVASNPTTSDQDPIRLSNLLTRAKSIRKMTAKRQGTEPGTMVIEETTIETTVVDTDSSGQAESAGDISDQTGAGESTPQK